MFRSVKSLPRRAACGSGVGNVCPRLAVILALALPLGAGCSRGGYSGGGSDAGAHDLRSPAKDAAPPDLVMAADLLGTADLRPPIDFAGSTDFAVAADFATPPDLAAAPDFAAAPDLATGSITGGPCMSGSSGATAFRVRWTDDGGRASVNYEVHGLPDKTRWKVGAFGYGTGYVPQFADPFLGPGGLQLDGSSFIDVELSTAGVHRINSITLSVFGRSYSTGSSGSFNWMTSTGGGATATNYVSNVAPYRWYPADITTAINPDDGRILLRIKAGGSSGSLVVNRLELCIDAS